MVSNGTFWLKYKVSNSPSDGHCLLYSLVTSVNDQLPSSYGTDIERIKVLMQDELQTNMKEYIPFTVCMSCDDLTNELYNYIKYKKFNTTFGDLAPSIIANALKVDILIIEENKTQKTTNITDVVCNGKSNSNRVLLHKQGMHYNGIIQDKKNSAYEIKMCTWNVQSLSEKKLSEECIENLVRDCDIIMLTETWLDVNRNVDIKGFTFKNYPRLQKHKKAHRNSGGIGIYIKKHIEAGVEYIYSYDDCIVWYKLDKEFFDIKQDIYICTVYIPPKDSTYKTDIDLFDCLLESACRIPTNASMIICGDFNARTGVKLEYDEPCDGDGENKLSSKHYTNEHMHAIEALSRMDKLKRYSYDTVINEYGQKLLSLCRSMGLLICNGRLGKDKTKGRYTRLETTGKSVVDYVLCTPDVFVEMSNFDIKPKLPESDHCIVCYSIPMNNNINKFKTGPETNDLEPVLFTKNWRYMWNEENLVQFKEAFYSDSETKEKYKLFLESMSELKNVNEIALLFNQYITTPANNCCKKKMTKLKKTKTKPGWFDADCVSTRKEVVWAGVNYYNHGRPDLEKQVIMKTCEYRRLKQRKKRAYQSNICGEIEKAKGEYVWALLDKYLVKPYSNVTPTASEFYYHFAKLAVPSEAPNFEFKYKNEVKSFLTKYDSNLPTSVNNNLIKDILSRYITIEEVNSGIMHLKSGKSPGIDLVPAEFIKCASDEIAYDLVQLYNYIIEVGEYPEIWAEGIRTPVPKIVGSDKTNDYRGITVQPVLGKLFEEIVKVRINFVNEAYRKVDKYNGGFLKGARTSDNMFIINGLVQRQLNIGQNLFVCFIDFSKAFDMVDRNILFYKVLIQGFEGKIINVLRNMYTKTKCKVKTPEGLSPYIQDVIGVNQGGILSPMLFRKYLSDLDAYLSLHCGVVIEHEIISHLLWADDLVLMSNTIKGMECLLKRLYTFCAKNRMVVNLTKTKMMTFGNPVKHTFEFNGIKIENVTKYKYLGNIISPISRIGTDIFKSNYEYQKNQGLKAMYAMLKKTSSFGRLPPKTALHLFDSLVKPVLIYGSDVWGSAKLSHHAMESVHLQYLRMMLGVKQSTCKLMLYGETGRVPIYYHAIINVLKYWMRLRSMPDTQLVKQVYNSLLSLHQIGIKTWITGIENLLMRFKLTDLWEQEEFIIDIKKHIISEYCSEWENLMGTDTYPIMRTYRMYKTTFGIENYLSIPDYSLRRYISKLRLSSHTLAVEVGRYTRPKTPVEKRQCLMCDMGSIEDEVHFICNCEYYKEERDELLTKLWYYDPASPRYGSELFKELMSLQNTTDLLQLGKFIQKCYKKRSSCLNSRMIN